MKIIIICILVFVSNTIHSKNSELKKASKSIKNIEMKLETEAEINNALFTIKKDNIDNFNMLTKLRTENPKNFKNKLRNYYYTLLNTRILKSKMNPKKKGYRLLVKESMTKLRTLKDNYSTEKNENNRNKIMQEIQKEASLRYEIELNENIRRLNQAKKLVTTLEKKTEKLSNTKDNYIQRTINLLIKNENEKK